jgi:hypothetical protein
MHEDFFIRCGDVKISQGEIYSDEGQAFLRSAYEGDESKVVCTCCAEKNKTDLEIAIAWYADRKIFIPRRLVSQEGSLHHPECLFATSASKSRAGKLSGKKFRLSSLAIVSEMNRKAERKNRTEKNRTYEKVEHLETQKLFDLFWEEVENRNTAERKSWTAMVDVFENAASEFVINGKSLVKILQILKPVKKEDLTNFEIEKPTLLLCEFFKLEFLEDGSVKFFTKGTSTIFWLSKTKKTINASCKDKMKNKQLAESGTRILLMLVLEKSKTGKSIHISDFGTKCVDEKTFKQLTQGN